MSLLNSCWSSLQKGTQVSSSLSSYRELLSPVVLLLASVLVLSSPGVGGDRRESIDGGDTDPSSCGISPLTSPCGGDTTSGGCVAFRFFALVILGEVAGLGCTVADITLEADLETAAAYEPLGAVTATLPFDGCCGS